MKNFMLRIALLVLMGVTGFISRAETVTVDEIVYELDADAGTAMVVRTVDGSLAKADIKAYVSYEGVDYPVVKIGEWAFGSMSNLTELIIPNTVREICHAAFYRCSNLAAVDIPGSVTALDTYAFYGCALTELTIPESVTFIDSFAFGHCENLTEVVIPATVATIGCAVFSACDALTSITVNEGNSNYTDIDGVLYTKDLTHLLQCPAGLSEVNLPATLSVIDDRAFDGCKLLTNLTLPTSVTQLNYQPFADCENLTEINLLSENAPSINDSFTDIQYETIEITVPDNSAYRYLKSDWSRFSNMQLASGDPIDPNIGSAITYEGLKYEILGNRSVAVAVQDENCPTNVVIPAFINVEEEGEDVSYKVVEIYNDAFKGNKNIFKIEFGPNITHIGARAFQDCEILNFEELPESLVYVGEEAFKGCNAIKKIKLPESTTTLGAGCFSDMAKLQRAILFSNVKVLPDNAFRDNPELEEVYLPEKLIKIGAGCFGYDHRLEEIVLPPTLVEIGDRCFEGGAPIRTGLKQVTIPPLVKRIGTAFQYSGLQSIDLGSVEEIAEGAFALCYELREVKFSENLKSIGNNAFAMCAANCGWSMTDIILPESVESIGVAAFDGSNVMKLSVGNNVTNLGYMSCGAPTILTLGENIKTIDPRAFDPYKIQIIKMNTLIPPTVAEAFPLTEKEMRNITIIVPTKEARELYKSHERWKYFNVVVLDESTATIYLDGTQDIAAALYDQTGLMPADVTRLTITSGHITDDDFAIIKENMINLLYFDMANVDNEIIPNEAFSDNRSIETIILPNGLKKVGNHSFLRCASLDIPYLPDGIEDIGHEAFLGCDRLSISKLPENLKIIQGGAFDNCPSLKSIVFGPNVEVMGWYTFASCLGLEYVDMSQATKIRTLPYYTFIGNYRLNTLLLPEGLEGIEREVIAETKMKTIDLPGTVTRINEGAFSSTKLRVITFGEGIKEIPDRCLFDSDRLLTINLPSSLEYVGDSAFENATHVTAISCMAQTAPTASSATFNDTDTRSCILSVPANSFFSYLSALGWGMFSNIQNTLEIDIPDDVEITTIPEDDYQDLREEEESQERAEGNVAENEESDDEESQEEQDESQRVCRLMAKQQRETTKSLLSGERFCKLHNGSVLASEENENSKGHRVFIRAKDGQPITSVTVNGIEMVDKLEGNSLVLPAGSLGKLVVNGGSTTTSVESVNVDSSAETICDVYTIAGQKVFTGRKNILSGNLATGIYIVKPQDGSKAFKLVVK